VKAQVFRIHWLMLALVACKTLTLMAQVGVCVDRGIHVYSCMCVCGGGAGRVGRGVGGWVGGWVQSPKPKVAERQWQDEVRMRVRLSLCWPDAPSTA
jgi:hypothetical protein